MKRIAIIGHGPSLLKMEAGEYIDSYDIVIRHKRLSQLTNYPDNYGTKTDIVSCSLVVAPSVKPYWPKVDQFIAFHDSRTQNLAGSDLVDRVKDFENPIMDKPLCDFWDEYYRTLKGDDPGHPHTSAGMHTLMFVGKYLSPCKVTLFGFDSVATGIWTWSVTRGKDYDNYPDHNFTYENRMLPALTAVYPMIIEACMPEVTE